MERQERAAIAQETISILQSGAYAAPNGVEISIRERVAAACAGTRLYPPDQLGWLMEGRDGWAAFPETQFGVSNRTTLAAGRALAEEFPALACLNFASAKRPGGGFLNGSAAQEESLARSSGLYATLQTQPEFYTYHRRLGTSFYSSHVIFSPSVPVFRDDAGRLLEQPWTTSFLTAAAVNAGALGSRGRGRQEKIAAAMEERMRMVLAVAAHHRCEALVLGAWGCGVFRNDPQQIASLFGKVLTGPPFANRFRHIEFAVYDPTPNQTVITPFTKVFQWT